MSGFLSAVRNELPNKDFRDSYVAENVRRGIAYQIKALRQARGWSPSEFARQAGLPPSNISRWENRAYGKFSLSTLLEIAAVFDVALSVRFVGFEELLASVSDLRPNKLAPPNFMQERAEASEREKHGASQRGSALEAFYSSAPKQYDRHLVEDQKPVEPLLPRAPVDSGVRKTALSDAVLAEQHLRPMSAAEYAGGAP